MSKKAVLYLRCQMHTEIEKELDKQRSECLILAGRKGLSVQDEYIDYGSTVSCKRPGLDSLISDALHNKFDVVIVDDIARLYRDAMKRHKLFTELRGYKVQVNSNSNESGQKLVGEMMKIFMLAMSQDPQKHIRKRHQITIH